MDPNATLETLRAYAANILKDESPRYALHAVDITELAELIEALDEWLVRGGFLPAAWRLGKAHRELRDALRWSLEHLADPIHGQGSDYGRKHALATEALELADGEV